MLLPVHTQQTILVTVIDQRKRFVEKYQHLGFFRLQVASSIIVDIACNGEELFTGMACGWS
jgi:hypothetical protein